MSALTPEQAEKENLRKAARAVARQSEARVKALMCDAPDGDDSDEGEDADSASKTLYGYMWRLAEDSKAGCKKTAGRLLRAIGDDGESMTRAAAADAVLNRLRAATGEGPEGEDLPALADNSTALRAGIKDVVASLRLLVTEEVERRVRGTSPGPVRSLFGAGDPGGEADGDGLTTRKLVLTTESDKKDVRYTDSSVYLSKQVPAAAHRAHEYEPSKAACLTFDEYKVAGAKHVIPKLPDVVKAGRATDVPAGRSSKLGETKTALYALQRIHAGPMPTDEEAPDSEPGEATCEVKVADGKGGVARKKRVAVLSAHVVDEVIAELDGALHPLSEGQQADYCGRFWNEFIKEAARTCGAAEEERERPARARAPPATAPDASSAPRRSQSRPGSLSADP